MTGVPRATAGRATWILEVITGQVDVALCRVIQHNQVLGKLLQLAELGVRNEPGLRTNQLLHVLSRPGRSKRKDWEGRLASLGRLSVHAEELLGHFLLHVLLQLWVGEGESDELGCQVP